MFTSKERSNLNGLAQKIDSICQIGKNGITDNVVESISTALEARELVKVTVLNNIDVDIREVADEVANKLGAEVVSTIGRKIILYRRSNKKGIEHIKF